MSPQRFGSICLLLLFSLSPMAQGSQKVPEALEDGVKGNPGTQTCMRQKFLPVVADLFGHLVDTEFAKVNPPETTVKLSKGQGSVAISNMRFVNFTTTKKHTFGFLPPNDTEWISSGLNFNISGQFRSTLQQLFSSSQTDGAVLLVAKNATVTVRTRLLTTKDGKQKLQLHSCKAKFAHATVSTQASGFFGALSKFFQTALASSANSILENVTCTTVRFYVETILNVVYAKSIPSTVPVFEKGGLLPTQLIYNYGLLRDARVYKNCLGMQESGEVSWEGKGGTPFHPPRLNYSTKLVNDHMMDIWVSDYAVNSLLYHANARRSFDLVLDDGKIAAAQLTSQLQSQCPTAANGGGECIGNALPELADDFPSQVVELHLNPSNSSTAPYVLFRDDLPILLSADFVLDIFATNEAKERKKVLNADVTLESHVVKVKLDSSSIFRMNIAASNCTVEINEDELSLTHSTKSKRAKSLGAWLAALIEKILNEKLAPGIAAPKVKGMKLVKSEAAVLGRTMNIATDVEMDQAFWSNAASQARLRAQPAKKP